MSRGVLYALYLWGSWCKCQELEKLHYCRKRAPFTLPIQGGCTAPVSPLAVRFNAVIFNTATLPCTLGKNTIYDVI